MAQSKLLAEIAAKQLKNTMRRKVKSTVMKMKDLKCISKAKRLEAEFFPQNRRK